MARIRVLKNGQPIKELEIDKTQGLLVGRSDNCQLILDDDAISRSHFRIFREQDSWTLERLSKYGALLYGDTTVNTHQLQNGDSFAVPPYLFQFEDIAENVVEDKQSQDIAVNDDRTPAVIGAEPTSLEVVRAIPYLTIKRGTTEEVVRLEGQSWVAGRDENCELYVEDPRCSRQHCRFFKDGIDFRVMDLGSSNGTHLNSENIGDKPREIQSGDTVQIGDTLLVFELRDPLYEQLVSDLNTPASPEASPVVYVPVNLSPAVGGPAAVRIDFSSEQPKPNKAKAMRFGLIVVIIALVAFALMDDGSQESSMASKKPAQKTKKADPFAELTPDDQEFVKRTYNLSKNLFMQTKYELALAEIRKVHEKIPAYLDSKDIESLCQNALQTIANKKYEEELERRQKDALDNARKIANECQRRFTKSTDLAGAEACLAPAMEFDPENADARRTLENVRNLIEQKELEKTNKAEFQRRVRSREALYNRAKQLESQGRLMDAIDAYGRHIASTLPDPKNLEVQSKKGIDSINGRVRSEMDAAIQASEDHLANTEYKEAVNKLEKALELDPNNAKARQIYEQASKELYKKMKALFSDSVVEESLGNVEPAKIKWRKIVEQDSSKGEYRQKALIKLKKYGE